ncbi:hypothetical protein ASPZODRAFT_137280 [Penicilliopsis zonata CBS 506.65]|uniref:Zn(2)-C6 fungal-type domain-containing protein n=1 Tax=Penicilliopsis zonata CBS 506.65 TaxID=1073090 RepID=A0A1L9S5P9_9EURO|nr:hypothetical protein ASPZODRAFT_137280 [Penicilliopsis zonata CBS 506.65]OJJ42474.1 hypothetical protein ASPZODRAFT_137280 [Penicilliopsis zonata CBS 506.65]
MSPQGTSRARASRSCGNCRAVKRRCDQKLPHCGQCIRTQSECPGYRDEWELVFRDQTKQTITRSRKKEAEKTASSTKDHDSPRPVCGLGPSVDEIGVNYFLRNFVVGGQSPAHGFLNYIPTVFSADGEHRTLVASLAAVGLMAMAGQQPELTSHARLKYSEAIHNINRALASPVESVKDSTLMSVISLGVFEHISSFESWVRHVEGAAALVVARGRSQFSNPAAILMFNQVRADMVVACIQRIQPFPADMWELQEEASRRMQGSSAFWSLGVLATRCVNLLWSVTFNGGKTAWCDLLDVGTRLQDELEDVAGILAVQAPYTTTRDVAGDPEIVYNGRIDLYSTSWTIRLWNHARILRIITGEIVYYLLAKILAMGAIPAGQTAQMQCRVEETVQTLSALGDDILATVPQALGFVSAASGAVVSRQHHASIDHKSHASVSGGYMLTWCLYTVGKAPVIKSQTRWWIIRRLEDIGKIMGIALALDLAEDVVRIEKLIGDSDRN